MTALRQAPISPADAASLSTPDARDAGRQSRHPASPPDPHRTAAARASKFPPSSTCAAPSASAAQPSARHCAVWSQRASPSARASGSSSPIPPALARPSWTTRRWPRACPCATCTKHASCSRCSMAKLAAEHHSQDALDGCCTFWRSANRPMARATTSPMRTSTRDCTPGQEPRVDAGIRVQPGHVLPPANVLAAVRPGHARRD